MQDPEDMMISIFTVSLYLFISTRVGHKNRLKYITCKNVRTFYVRHLIFGHFLSHFRQISDNLLKRTLSEFVQTKHELD